MPEQSKVLLGTEPSPQNLEECLKLAASMVLDFIPGGKAMKALKGAAAKLGIKKVEKQLLKEAQKVAKRVLKERGDILKLAKKYGLNAKSTTTKQLLENFNMKASDWIGKYRKGSIKSILGEVGDKTIGEIFATADSRTRKLLIDGRFAK